jgi:hypothetical protein
MIKHCLKIIRGGVRLIYGLLRLGEDVNSLLHTYDTKLISIAGFRNTFKGYYDDAQVRDSELIVYATNAPIWRMPKFGESVHIYLVNIVTGEQKRIGTTLAWNWQQGAKASWLTDTEIVFNYIHEDRIYAQVVNREGDELRSMLPPIQYSIEGSYFSISYNNLTLIRRDYGYSFASGRPCIEPAALKYVDLSVQSIESCYELTEISEDSIFSLLGAAGEKATKRKLNHVIANSAVAIFMARYWRMGSRYSPLVVMDRRTGSLMLSDSDHVFSHYCIDNNNIYATYRFEGKEYLGLFTFDKGRLKKDSEIRCRDGHPFLSGDNLLLDSYPDNFSTRALFVLDKNNLGTKKRELGKVLDVPLAMGPMRCDLHPVISESRIIVDVIKGVSRKVAVIYDAL